MDYDILQGALITATASATVLLFPALGAAMSQQVGVANYGIEGCMLMGGVLGFITASQGGSAAVALLAGGVGAAVFTFIGFAVPVVVLKADETITGFAVWFVGVGLSAVIGRSVAGTGIGTPIPQIAVPGLKDIPLVGPALFDQPWPTYLGVLTAVLIYVILKRTRHGLNIRAIGADADAARLAGVPVQAWKLLWLTAGGFLMGVGGAVLTVAVAQTWESQITAFRGYLAYALVLLVLARPLSLLWASYLFGFLLVLGSVGQLSGWPIPSPFLDMLPYLAVCIVLALRGISDRATPTSSRNSRRARATLRHSH